MMLSLKYLAPRMKFIHVLLFFGLRELAWQLARANLQALERVLAEAKNRGFR